jgi:hypothetical protein
VHRECWVKAVLNADTFVWNKGVWKEVQDTVPWPKSHPFAPALRKMFIIEHRLVNAFWWRLSSMPCRVATIAKRNQIFFAIITRMAAELLVMDFEIFQRSAILATPAGSVKYDEPQLCIRFGT